MLKSRYIWINGFIGFLTYLSLSAFAELWGIPYLIQVYHLSKAHAASAISMVFLGWAIGCPLSGWFSDFICRRRLPIVIGSLLALVLISIVLYVPNLSLTSLYILLFLFGVATSVEVIIFAISRETSNSKIAGTAISLANAIVMLGGVFFQPIIGFILDMFWDGKMLNGINVYSVKNYQLALSVLPIGFLICLILCFFQKETYCKLQADF